MNSRSFASFAPRIQGNGYRVSADEKRRFEREGYVHLRQVLTEEELAGIETVYGRFLRREIEVPGRDFCDMAGEYDRPVEAFELINVMLPRRYHPAWQGNMYELRAASIAQQLQGPDLILDYDQLLAKPPRKEGAVFQWHQDQAYWPPAADPRTATCWLALDDADEQNGSMRFVPGSHREAQLREHGPLHGDRDRSHTLVAEVDEARDRIVQTRLCRGDITVHAERVLHGSGPNSSDRWRRAYIVAFRSRTTVEAQRRAGFTHSHNDSTAALERLGDTS